MNSSVYYRKTKDAVNRVAITTNETVFVNGIETPVIRRLPINLGTKEQFGEFNTSLRLIKRHAHICKCQFFRVIENGSYLGRSYDTESTSWSGNLRNSYRLPLAIQITIIICVTEVQTNQHLARAKDLYIQISL